MKLHRFYLPLTDLTHSFWMDDEKLYHQWTKVLRFELGREVELFNEQQETRLYRIVKFGTNAAHVELVTQLEPRVPRRDIYLCFAILKKDKNEWVLQKATELGIRHFVPLLTDRTEKTGWDMERAKKIVVEAAEQCGRSDIPRIRLPITPQKITEELKGKATILVAEQGGKEPPDSDKGSNTSIAILIGPEGGWSDAEKFYFEQADLVHTSISDFTLRAETACITAAALLQ